MGSGVFGREEDFFFFLGRYFIFGFFLGEIEDVKFVLEFEKEIREWGKLIGNVDIV